MSEDRTSYAVWPNDDRMPLAEALAALDAGTLGKSDDFLRVSLTEEQAVDLTHDEMIRAMRQKETP